ncbi:MAG: TetM/TetW/TetO/TetS family tetracycline resistance ribosomal protection protein [Lachnospiraceae bacterium]|nr:TetM/TetW/TetO/TetS family tetracycline resistance ribosomal protection protein [Lachnospiraceae bacterium]
MKKVVCGILAHVDAGKTTLSEALLYKAGVIKTLGRVDSKNTYLDTDASERERGITIYTKSARLVLGDFEMILIDTPGHTDFSAEMERALSVLDMAVLLISASDGVSGHTKTLWSLLKRHNIPTVFFVNKMDLPDVEKTAILADLKRELSAYAMDFSVPGCIGFDEKTIKSRIETGADVFPTATDAAEYFENAATATEDMMAEYFDKESVSGESTKEAFLNRKLFPCLFGSALKQDGVESLVNVLAYLAPVKNYPDEFGAYAYKITRDSQGVRLSHLKITGGSLKVKEMLGEEKVNELRLYSGDKYESAKEVFAGDIVAVPALSNTLPGTVFGIGTAGKLPSLEPVLEYAVLFDRSIDITRMHNVMKELEEEEPGLHVEYDEALREIHVRLMGEVQTEILSRRLHDDYGLDVSFGQGKISYRETINNVVEGVGHFEPLRHYAEVHLKMEPLERGSGLVFESEVSVNDLLLNWQRLILTHLKEREHRGVLTGSPVTDMKFTLVAGRAHLKHTEGGDFRQATYRAVRQGLMQAENVLLEPYYDFTLEIPDNMVGRAMTDLDRMFCTTTVSESVNGLSVLNGRGPVATLNGYARDVMAYTHGKGHISLVVAGYDKCHNPEEVIEARGYNPEADIRNTPDSVFCSHGAGVVVPWNEVHLHMHLPFSVGVSGESKEEKPLLPNHGTEKEREWFVSTEEIDSIINKTAYANTKSSHTSYKGRSSSLIERQRTKTVKENKETVYKGTTFKDKYMLIDGYNVIHAWPELKELAAIDLSAAAGRLIDIVSNYQGIMGYNTIVVFDAYKLPNHPREELVFHNIKVVYTKTAETADRYIERYSHENGKKYDITVVTSDGVEQVIIRGAGCNLLSSKDFLSEVNRASESISAYKNV